MAFDRPGSDPEETDREGDRVDRPDGPAAHSDRDARVHRYDVLREEEDSELLAALLERNRNHSMDVPSSDQHEDGTGDAAESSDAYRGTRWEDERSRRAWVEEILADNESSRPAKGPEGPALDYQRQTAGPREVWLRSGDGATEIWADGVSIDTDHVAAIESKYVERPGMSMYQGDRPQGIQEVLMRQFDAEITRYGQIMKDDTNPVARLRLVTNTESAADYLSARASSILGPGPDLDIRIEPLTDKEHD